MQAVRCLTINAYKLIIIFLGEKKEDGDWRAEDRGQRAKDRG
jgi:hypothetical protein